MPWIRQGTIARLLLPHAIQEVLMSAEANAAGRNPAPTTSRFTLREQLHGARYGEVLLVMGRLNRIEATVYNTLGLSECPEEVWRTLDPEAIKKTYKARAAILNGPRYFLMDKISIADPGEEIFDFGGLQMRRTPTGPPFPRPLP